MWFRENIKCEVIISDHLKHNKTPIVFMDQLFSLKNPDINTIKVWSDGHNSQFKNKYVIGSLDLLSKNMILTFRISVLHAMARDLLTA